MNSINKVEVVLGEIVLTYDPRMPERPEVTAYERPVLIEALGSAQKLAVLMIGRLFNPPSDLDEAIVLNSKIRKELVYLREVNMGNTANELVAHYQQIGNKISGF